MDNTTEYPIIDFGEPLTEREIDEITVKGWLGTVTVETAAGCRYSVFFTDPIRLAADLSNALKRGVPTIAEPGMIVIPEVTLEAVHAAVEYLWREGFFAHLKSIESVPT